MMCQSCRSRLTPECQFCPQCGQPALFARSGNNGTDQPNGHSTEDDVRIAATGSLANLALLIPDSKYRPNTPAPEPTTAKLIPRPIAMRGSSPPRHHANEGKKPVSSLSNVPASLSMASRPAISRPAGGALMPLRTQQFQPLLTQANIHRLRHQWDAATDACIAVLRAQPDNRHAHSLLGDIYRDQGKTDDAKQWYRMALELEPNPNDERKLRLLESGKGLRRIAPPATGLLPSKTDLALHTGTTPLMSLSPRRWLRGITVASVAFLGVVIIGLGVMQIRNQRAPKAAASTTGFLSDPTALQRLSRMTPVHDAGGTTASARSTTALSSSETSGDSGFAPDQPRVSPTAPLQQLVRKAQTPRTATKSEVGVARPLDVLPLPVPAPTTDTETGAAQAGMTGVKPASLPAPDAYLPGGLRVRRVDKDPVNGTARLFVAAPASFAASLSAVNRDVLLRGAFRAARSVARADNRIGRLDVLISVPGNGADSGLLETTLDATTALAADLTASADTLISQTLSLRWLAALPNDSSSDNTVAPNNP